MKKLKNQNGRSMIEMLGVLAIIGVLSVGGIAGYSKAMMKYRINKTIEQITLIAGNVRAFFGPQRSYSELSHSGSPSGLSEFNKILKKAKLMPDEMWDDTDKRFKNVFGYNVDLGTASKAKSGDNQAFYIEYNIPKDYDVCIELLSYDWSTAGVKGIKLGFANMRAAQTIPATIEEAVSSCSTVINKLPASYPTIDISFYFDVNSNCWSETNGNTCS